jgi:secreted trypsin-like serine protease
MNSVVICAIFLVTLSHAENFEKISFEIKETPRLLKTSRIINGENVVGNQFAHQADLEIFWTRIEDFDEFFSFNLCGGSLIQMTVVITAAHCMKHLSYGALLPEHCDVYFLSSPTKITVYERDNNGVKNFFIHEKYNPRTFVNDLALIRLPNPIQSTGNIKPIALPTSTDDDYVGDILIASGFGLTESKTVSTVLKYTEVIGISNNKCSETFNIIANTTLCTVGYPNSNQSACIGDSGGQLITKDSTPVLVGVVSFGSGSGKILKYFINSIIKLH